ncbi:MAG: helix-turn-helix transcriptional regulator [Desulfovibrionaceae bacterium]|nr:helix-turn-helix transcriptional regulator [Desulfovibrionaceae bacterium]
MENFKPVIKSNLMQLMKERGYSIRLLAACTRLSVQTIQRARSSHISECRLKTLQTIANVLNLPVGALFEVNGQSDAHLLPSGAIRSRR